MPLVGFFSERAKSKLLACNQHGLLPKELKVQGTQEVGLTMGEQEKATVLVKQIGVCSLALVGDHVLKGCH